MHSQKTTNSLAKRFIESAGILFTLLLVSASIVYAFTTWSSGEAPQTSPGLGNVELVSGSGGNSNYVGSIDTDTTGTATGTILKCNAGETTMTMTGGGWGGYGCKVTDQGLSTVRAEVIQSGAYCQYACFAGGSGGSGDSDWTVSGNDMYSGVSGNVGIGTTSPEAKLTVVGGVQTASAPVARDDICTEAQWGEIRRCTHSGLKILCQCREYDQPGKWRWRGFWE